MECCFAAGARACDMCIRLDINCRPHASQQGRGTDLLLSKGLSTITERKDGSSVEGDKVLASRQMRRIIPTVHDSSFQSEMDTLDIFCQGTRLIWFVDDSNLLDCRRISNRISMDKVGVCKVTMQHQYYIEVIHC